MPAQDLLDYVIQFEKRYESFREQDCSDVDSLRQQCMLMKRHIMAIEYSMLVDGILTRQKLEKSLEEIDKILKV
jgi:hypothetical protein